VYLAEIETARKEDVVFRTIEKLPAEPETARIILCAALIKFDHFEWLIEKATELGVSEIIPVQATRSEHGLERAAMKRLERWRKIALEASQQSRRAKLPEIAQPSTFEHALAVPAEQRYVLDESRDGERFAPSPGDTALLIGPEGGWTEEERA